MPPAAARERLTRCFAAVFPDLDTAATASASRNTVDTWDSIAAMTLFAVTEEEFGVQFAPEAIDQLDSFAAILDYLEHAAAAPAP